MSLSRRRYRKRESSSMPALIRPIAPLETSEMSSSSRRRCEMSEILGIGRSILLDAVEINERADGRLVITSPPPTSRSFCGAKRRRRGAKSRPTGVWDAGVIIDEGERLVVESQSNSSGIYSVLLTRALSIFAEANCIPSSWLIPPPRMFSHSPPCVNAHSFHRAAVESPSTSECRS